MIDRVLKQKRSKPMSESDTAFASPLPKDLTLRDWFAALAMQQVIQATADPGSIAARAYKIADAMIAARSAGRS
jgi:hypothetical protein